MNIFNRKTATEKLMESKTDDELRAIINEGRTRLVQQLMVIHEFDKRLHEVKFHGREGNADELAELLDKGWSNIISQVRGM